MGIMTSLRVLHKEFPLILWVLVTVTVTGAFLLAAKSIFGITNSGSFGDSFGFLTALFSGLAFAAAWHLIQLQKVEMQSLKREMESRGKSELSRLMIEQWCSTVSGIRHGNSRKDNEEINHFKERLIPILARIQGLEGELDMELILPILRNDFQSISGVIYALKEIDKNDYHQPIRLVLNHFRDQF